MGVAECLITAGADANSSEMRVGRVAAATSALSAELYNIKARAAAVQLRMKAVEAALKPV